MNFSTWTLIDLITKILSIFILYCFFYCLVKGLFLIIVIFKTVVFKKMEKILIKLRIIRYKKQLTTTLKWSNIAGSLLFVMHEMYDFENILGGYGKNIEITTYKKRLKKTLIDYWEIENHNSAIRELNSLIEQGHRKTYEQKILSIIRKDREKNLDNFLELAEGKETNGKDSYIFQMLLGYKKHGKNALLGWDMSRCICVAQWSYLLGYIDMNEMFDFTIYAGKKIQDFFSSWEEVMKSYLLGLQYWERTDRNNQNSMTNKRWTVYQQLKQNGMYLKIPFNLPLHKEITKDKYGRVKVKIQNE